jgi:hypothetical protein
MLDLLGRRAGIQANPVGVRTGRDAGVLAIEQRLVADEGTQGVGIQTKVATRFTEVGHAALADLAGEPLAGIGVEVEGDVG